jgi:hypothetical protein
MTIPQALINKMVKMKINKEKKQNGSANFTEAVEKKIQELIIKGKEEKAISEPKPKSGKGL